MIKAFQGLLSNHLYSSIKIVDFGLARNLSKEPGGEVRTLCGTPEFVAPGRITNAMIGSTFPTIDNFSIPPLFG